MPTNLYGPGDNFNLATGHVLPTMIRRFHEAKLRGAPNVVCWGTGEPRREFLYVDDFAEACHLLLEQYDGDLPINVGTGSDMNIAELARLTADVVGYCGEIEWDKSKPDGTPRKLLDVSRINGLGWKAQTTPEAGIRTTYQWFVEHYRDCRK
jgi:GDP-L-fucose synthase